MTAPTLRDLLAEIMDDLDRPDLEAQIRRGVAAAVRRYQSKRLGFNERYFTFETIPDADVYGQGDTPEIPGLYAIDSVVLVEGNQVTPLTRVSEAWIDEADRPGSASRPCCYAYFGETLRLWPTPSDAWTIRIAGHVRLDVPADDVPSPWFDQGRDLIASRAKWHVALHVLRDQELATLMGATGADALNTLRSSANGISATGQVAAWD